MKRTLLVTNDYYPSVGGVSRYWEQLGDKLPFEAFVVLAPRLTKGVAERISRYSIIRKKFSAVWLYPHWLLLVFVILSVCRKYNIERIIAAQILPIGTAVFLACGVLRIPYIISCHGMDVLLPKKEKRKTRIARTALRHAERVIVNAITTGRVVEEYGVPKAHIEYVYPCPVITPHSFPQRGAAFLEAYRSQKILLTVGRLVSRKGHEYVLRALPGILAEDPNLIYCIIGDGPARQHLKELVSELNIEHAVVFAEQRSDEEIAQWYDACTIFIMTPEEVDGDVEGFGMVYLEANSFGKPVIGARTGGVAEAVHDGVTGLLVEPRDIVGIQAALLRLLSDPAYAQTLGENGRRRVEEEFQWKRQAEKLQYLLSL